MMTATRQNALGHKEVVVTPGPTSCGDVPSYLTPELVDRVMGYVRSKGVCEVYTVLQALADCPSVYVAGAIAYLVGEGRLKQKFGYLSVVDEA